MSYNFTENAQYYISFSVLFYKVEYLTITYQYTANSLDSVSSASYSVKKSQGPARGEESGDCSIPCSNNA